MIILKLEDKTIELNTHEVEGQILYKAQDLLKVRLSTKESIDKVRNWLKTMRNKRATFTPLTLKGCNGGTYLSKRNMYKLAGYISYEFEDAVYEAFEALSEGRNLEATALAGSVVIDVGFAKKVSAKWLEYIAWSYGEFKEVNSRYGGNMTRMVVKTATGVPTVAAVQGKVGEGMIERIVEQGNGAALNAINATLDLISNYTRTKVCKEQMTTREGKKQVYATLSQMLDWNEQL